MKALCGAVITPSALYVPIEIAEKESIGGLRYYSSFSELKAWISRNGVTGAEAVSEGLREGAEVYE